jgi:hypothetical protein
MLCQAVTSALTAILAKRQAHRRWPPPLRVRTDKEKEFLNAVFQGLLKGEGIEFRVSRNPDVKCTVIEDSQNKAVQTFRYIDVVNKFVDG